MRVLIACEESQVVCKAFRKRGHEAYSNDIQDCSGGHPEWHLKIDAIEAIEKYGPWDLIVAHPPCTYLSRAAGRWLYNPERLENTYKAFDFVKSIWNSNVPKIAIENPPGWLCTNWRRPSQKIHPWYFGDGEMKETCLWLKGLQRLQGKIHIAANRMAHHPKPIKSRMGSDGKMKNTYFVTRVRTAKARSKTFPGIAQAMAEQWG